LIGAGERKEKKKEFFTVEKVVGGKRGGIVRFRK